MPVVVLLLLLLCALGLTEANAITWNFDRAGDSQGWQARESAFSGASASTLSALPSEVREGVWRISLLPSVTEHAPSVVLVSPPIGHDSALFDRASLRFRVVHRQPIAGHFILAWTNQTNRATPGEWLSPVAGDTATAALLFRVGEEVTYTTAWQEIVVGDLRSGPVSERGIAYELHWEGDLIDIRFHLLFAADPWRGVSGRLEDVPEAVEIDRVVLTGVEEQLQGELPPPRIQETMSFGGLFAPAAFSPLGRKGIGAMGGFAVPFAVLGDLDDDHDLDLVTLVGPLGPSIEDGWLTALNDGHGKFEGSFFQSLPGPQGPLLAGADLDGNGRMDLVLGEGSQQVRVLYCTEGGWVGGVTFQDMRLKALTDADGDGDADLWLQAAGSLGVQIYYNDGRGQLASQPALVLSPPQPGFAPIMFIPLRGGTGVVWTPSSFELQGLGYAVTCVQKGEVTSEDLPIHFDVLLIRCAGDIDLDGDVDFLAGREIVNDPFTTWHGLRVVINNGNHSFEEIEWYEGVVLRTKVLLTDLNDDGVLDPAFVDSNERGSAVIVNLGQAGGIPVQEGRYPLQGQGGQVVAGDVDGDGDVDLVVLEKALEGQGGVHVLLNRLHDHQTAVTTASTAAQPAAPVLSPAYPNPFNAATLLPVSLPVDARQVRLEIYDLLGQPVKKLVDGPLSAGVHLVRWDGMDDRGVALSSGVYLYRLLASGTEAMGRVVLVR